MYFQGRVAVLDIVSATQVARMMATVFEVDADLLRAELAELQSIHIQVDISGRKGEERMAIFICGYNPKLQKNIVRNVWEGTLAS